MYFKATVILVRGTRLSSEPVFRLVPTLSPYWLTSAVLSIGLLFLLCGLLSIGDSKGSSFCLELGASFSYGAALNCLDSFAPLSLGLSTDNEGSLYLLSGCLSS